MDIRAPQRLGNADAALYGTLIGAGPMPPCPSDPLRTDRRSSRRTGLGSIRSRSASGSIENSLRQLVDCLLDREGARRIARRAHGAAGAGVDENIMLPAFEIGAGIGRLGDVADATAELNAGGAKACQRNRRQRSVAVRADFELLEGAGSIAGVHLLLFPVEDDSHRRSRLTRQHDRDAPVIAERRLRAEAPAHSLDDDAHAVQRQAECSASSCRTPAVNWVDMWTVTPSGPPVGDNGVRFQATMGLHARAVFVLDDDFGLGKALLDIAA